jgi:cbb3-type cytochrome oxidase maturation protein
MSVVYIALPVALLLALAGVIAFIWAVRSGQLDDLETPSQRILGDDDEPPPPPDPT